MSYKIMSRYYAESDNFGESYVITSTNSTPDTDLDIGSEVHLLPIEKLLTAMENMERESSGDDKPTIDEVMQGSPPDDIIDLSAPDEEPTSQPQFFKEGKKSHHPPTTNRDEPTDGPKILTPDQLPMSCQTCPICRTCPPIIMYNSAACNTDLENYYYSIAQQEPTPGNGIKVDDYTKKHSHNNDVGIGGSE
jgi:hypothetical protein